MWKGANNIAVVALLLGGIACTDKNNDGASSLLDEAKSSVSIADYSRAITLLDSIHKAFPDAFDQRQEAYSLRNEVDYKKTIADKQLTDSLLVDEQIRLDSILHYFKKVDSPELFRPYFIYKSLPAGSIILRSGIEPRVTDEGNMTMISSVVGRNVMHTSVSLISQNGASASTDDIPFDGEQNFRENGSELITYTASQCQALADFAAIHQNEKLSLRFNGKQSLTLPISESEIKALYLSSELAKTTISIDKLRRDSILLERKLQVVRDFNARQH